MFNYFIAFIKINNNKKKNMCWISFLNIGNVFVYYIFKHVALIL